eukprot:129490-Pleurochrysis_carterae.AAC.1
MATTSAPLACSSDASVESAVPSPAKAMSTQGRPRRGPRAASGERGVSAPRPPLALWSATAVPRDPDPGAAAPGRVPSSPLVCPPTPPALPVPRASPWRGGW